MCTILITTEYKDKDYKAMIIALNSTHFFDVPKSKTYSVRSINIMVTGGVQIIHIFLVESCVYVISTAAVSNAALVKGGGSIVLVVRQRKPMARLRAAKFLNLIIFMIMTSSQSAMSARAIEQDYWYET